MDGLASMYGTFLNEMVQYIHMQIDQEELLQRTYALAKENNKLIKKMRRGAWFGFIVKTIIFIGIPIWSYFTFVQPMLGQVMGMLGQVQGATGKAGATAAQVQGLLDSIPGLGALQELTQ